MTRPMRPIVPPPPGTKKADELASAEHDLFDGFLVIQELMAMGGVRCVTLAAGGIVNVVTSEDHQPRCEAHQKTKTEDMPSTPCLECVKAPAKPVIKRFLGINLFEGFLAAAAGGYAQVERMLEQTENAEVKRAAQQFIDHVRKIREVRTKRIITR